MPGSMDTEAPAREQVKKYLSRGWTPRQIALHMGISTQAVYDHMARIRELEEETA
jgi:hypothetical protein